MESNYNYYYGGGEEQLVSSSVRPSEQRLYLKGGLMRDSSGPHHHKRVNSTSVLLEHTSPIKEEMGDVEVEDDVRQRNLFYDQP